MEQNRSSRPWVVGIFLIGGIAVYVLWFHDNSPHTYSGDPIHQAWEGESEKDWRQWRYLLLSDRDAVHTTVAARIAESQLLKRLGLDNEQEKKLAIALTVALTALPASTPDDYLSAVSPIRRQRPSPQDAQLMFRYKSITGRPMAMDATSRQVLEELWARQKPRPKEASLADPNGVWWGISEWDTSNKKGKTFTTLNNIDPTYNEAAALWANPIGGGTVFVTEPPERSAGHPSSPLQCILFDTIVRHGEDYTMLGYSCFWSPILDDWVVEYASAGTDEGHCWIF
jgi:hypothetical protein